MSYIYSQALVEEFSQVNCSDTDALPQSNWTPIAKPCLWHDKMMEPSRLSRFGMMCKPSTDAHTEAMWTWLQEASRAKILASRGGVQVLTDNALECGTTWPASLAKYDPDSHTLKTAQLSLLEDLTGCLVTLPRSGLMLDGQCWEVSIQVPPTVENESGYLPTPRASVGTHGICWSRARTGEHRHQIEDFLGWLSLNHGGQVVSGRTVNPDFQDWLMVWPTGHTDLKPLGTDKFQQWQQLHSTY